MRYVSIPIVDFVTAEGVTVQVKDVRPRPGRAASSIVLTCSNGAMLDEVVTRKDALGAGMELLAYKVFEENDVEIVEAGFVAGRNGTIRVPR